MALKPEKICPNEGIGYKRFLKKSTARLRRRLGKKLLDMAPVKNEYRGYSD